jgi:hypothetical protein
MTQYNWSWWFILSTIWLVALFLVAMVDHPFATTGFFTFSIVVSALNMLGCLYIGCKPGELED